MTRVDFGQLGELNKAKRLLCMVDEQVQVLIYSFFLYLYLIKPMCVDFMWLSFLIFCACTPCPTRFVLPELVSLPLLLLVCHDSWPGGGRTGGNREKIVRVEGKLHGA